MTTCFVMQVFDNGPYDKRYEQTFAPAIGRGGATPLRADKILGTKPVIEKIEAALRQSTIAFAEISETNANVFTELGYALALGIPLVMVCDKGKRESLPFDIGHRPVIFYRTEAQGDFEQLAKDIQSAVGAALLDAEERTKAQASVIPDLRGQAPVDALKNRIVLEILEAEMGDPDGLSAYRLKTALTQVGYSERLTSLAALSLIQDGLIASGKANDYNGDEYLAYSLTDKGKGFILAQYADIKRAEEATLRPNASVKASPFDADLDDDAPF